MNEHFLLGLIVGIIFQIMLTFSIQPLYNITNPEFHMIGYHFHDSLYGILILLPVFLFKNKLSNKSRSLLLGIGMGIIMAHSAREGFIFITKD